MNLLSTLPVSLRQLQYIVAVADQGSFRRAAEICHVAQPSLRFTEESLKTAALVPGRYLQNRLCV